MAEMMLLRVLLSLLCCSAVSVASESLLTDRQSGLDRPSVSDPRVLFNHGATLAASGKFDEATEVLRQVAVVRDKSIAAKALSLLGQIAAAAAKQMVSSNPAETPSEHRQTVLNHLKSAERSFAESLSLLPNEDVRQHLETLRAWRHNVAHAWEEYDRAQLRNAELQQRVQWLADWEEKLTEKVRPASEKSNSPRKFQTSYETSGEQKRLAEELAILQETPLAPTDDEEFVEKWQRLPEIQQIANDAAELLSRNRMTEALPKQEQVLDYLRTLLKKDQDQQNRDQQKPDNQEQDDQERDQGQQQQQDQSPNSDQQQQPQPNEPKDDDKQEQEGNPQSSTPQGSAQEKEDDVKERAERLLMQVRRKEQAAEKRREQLRAVQIQAEPVEKDW